MGFFSYQCEACKHPLLSGYAANAINAWMQEGVFLPQDRRRKPIIGYYDGYGRLSGEWDAEEIPTVEHDEECRADGTVYHRACWEHAGKPKFTVNSPSARDQGYFYDDPIHNLTGPEDRSIIQVWFPPVVPDEKPRFWNHPGWDSREEAERYGQGERYDRILAQVAKRPWPPQGDDLDCFTEEVYVAVPAGFQGEPEGEGYLCEEGWGGKRGLKEGERIRWRFNADKNRYECVERMDNGCPQSDGKINNREGARA